MVGSPTQPVKSQTNRKGKKREENQMGKERKCNLWTCMTTQSICLTP